MNLGSQKNEVCRKQDSPEPPAAPARFCTKTKTTSTSVGDVIKLTSRLIQEVFQNIPNQQFQKT